MGEQDLVGHIAISRMLDLSLKKEIFLKKTLAKERILEIAQSYEEFSTLGRGHNTARRIQSSRESSAERVRC